MLTEEQVLEEYNEVVRCVARAAEILQGTENLPVEEKFRAMERAVAAMLGAPEE